MEIVNWFANMIWEKTKFEWEHKVESTWIRNWAFYHDSNNNKIVLMKTNWRGWSFNNPFNCSCKSTHVVQPIAMVPLDFQFEMMSPNKINGKSIIVDPKIKAFVGFCKQVIFIFCINSKPSRNCGKNWSPIMLQNVQEEAPCLNVRACCWADTAAKYVTTFE